MRDIIETIILYLMCIIFYTYYESSSLKLVFERVYLICIYLMCLNLSRVLVFVSEYGIEYYIIPMI